uniref:Uncharacterized protein n=1 Tax=Ascaris lumbricoides TaxID=6252 RepID=A0A9J2PF36_ASCLU
MSASINDFLLYWRSANAINFLFFGNGLLSLPLFSYDREGHELKSLEELLEEAVYTPSNFYYRKKSSMTRKEFGVICDFVFIISDSHAHHLKYRFVVAT